MLIDPVNANIFLHSILHVLCNEAKGKETPKRYNLKANDFRSSLSECYLNAFANITFIQK